MKTFVIGLFERSKNTPETVRLLEFSIQAEDEREAHDKLLPFCKI